MLSFQVDVYAGTGVPHFTFPRWLRKLPVIGQLLQPADAYYAKLTKMGRQFADYVNVIALFRLGLVNPKTRDNRADQVILHKVATHPFAWRIASGHSQGGRRALVDGLMHPSEVLGIIQWAPPNKGSPLASFITPTAGAKAMAPGSREEEAIMALQSDLIDRHRQDPSIRLPWIITVSGHHDILVPCHSAHHIHPDYPNVIKICLSDKDPGHGADVLWCKVGWWEATHIGMVRSDKAIKFVAEQVATLLAPHVRMKLVTHEVA